MDTRLKPHDPLSNSDGRFEIEAGNCLLDDKPVPLDVAADLLRI